MSDIAIRVDGLSKQYRIGKRERYKTLRDTLAHAASAPLRWARSLGPAARAAEKDEQDDLIWALKSVSFEVPQGAVVGVIGRNGAGKSTLLKILSRITEPTEGTVEIHGRVGSLLEVGTGFHPELTGRENIFLNGAILGMRRAEIVRKFDEIVAFAEVERFVDTPVKHFSSGMYMRLAFAVAAHLEPEILIVDEVLAVGDAQFQKKCLGRMGEVAKGGRTVIFVSHQMNQIRRLCGQCLWLEAGHVRHGGYPHTIVSAYEAAMSSPSLHAYRQTDESSVPSHFFKWEIIEPRNDTHNSIQTLGPIIVRLLLKVKKPICNGHHGLALFNKDGHLLWGADASGLKLTSGVHEFLYSLSTMPLTPGCYFWRASLYDDDGLVDVWDCVPELVVATQPHGHSRDEWAGLLNIPYSLAVQPCSQDLAWTG